MSATVITERPENAFSGIINIYPNLKSISVLKLFETTNVLHVALYITFTKWDLPLSPLPEKKHVHWFNIMPIIFYIIFG